MIYDQTELDIALESLDNAISSLALEASSGDYKKKFMELKESIDADGSTAKEFYANCKKAMDEKNVKEAISICMTHIEYIDDVLYSISKMTDTHTVKEYAETGGAILLWLSLVGTIIGAAMLANISSKADKINVAVNALQFRKSRVEGLRNELRARGASDKAYDMLSEIKRIRIDDRSHKAVIGVQET